jgi:hypothetical protein
MERPQQSRVHVSPWTAATWPLRRVSLWCTMPHLPPHSKVHAASCAVQMLHDRCCMHAQMNRTAAALPLAQLPGSQRTLQAHWPLMWPAGAAHAGHIMAAPTHLQCLATASSGLCSAVAAGLTRCGVQPDVAHAACCVSVRHHVCLVGSATAVQRAPCLAGRPASPTLSSAASPLG